MAIKANLLNKKNLTIKAQAVFYFYFKAINELVVLTILFNTLSPTIYRSSIVALGFYKQRL
jgi:hypothetical protein